MPREVPGLSDVQKDRCRRRGVEFADDVIRRQVDQVVEGGLTLNRAKFFLKLRQKDACFWRRVEDDEHVGRGGVQSERQLERSSMIGFPDEPGLGRMWTTHFQLGAIGGAENNRHIREEIFPILH